MTAQGLALLGEYLVWGCALLLAVHLVLAVAEWLSEAVIRAAAVRRRRRRVAARPRVAAARPAARAPGEATVYLPVRGTFGGQR